MISYLQRKILLSISILVSNRPDTVEKCLESLSSLRRRVPSELILVDTGSGERVRKIIESYGDKIVDFEWCNDFSRARNAGLKQAEGEWFLYLDDDEWFEDTEEIEDFFLSGKHLHYNCGSYFQRNYFDQEGRKYRDEYVGRLVRLEPGMEFIYSVHEVFSKALEPRIRLHSYVHHYGYAFRNAEEAGKHSQRNITLLLKEHEKDPGQLRHNAQLVQEYNALKAWEKSVDISLEGIQHAGPGAATEQFLGGLYVNAVRNYMTLGQHAEAVDIGEKYLALACANELAKAAVRYNLSIIYLETTGYTKCLEAVDRYLDFYGRWEKDRDATAYFECLTIPFMSAGCRQAALCIGVQAGSKLGDSALAKGYFDKIDWDAIRDIIATQSVQGMVQSLLRAWLLNNADTAQDNTDMLRVLLTDGMMTGMVLTELEILQKDMPEHDSADMGQIISDIPLYRWERAVRTALQEMGWQDVEEMQGHLEKILDAKSFHMLYWSIPCRMCRIRRMTEENGEGAGTSTESVVRELLSYATENEILYRRLYREELFREMPDLLPGECRVSLVLSDMEESVVEGDFERAISDIKEALEIAPELSEALRCCAEWVSEKSASRDRERVAARDEMGKLAESVKGQVRMLAAQGMLSEALGVLRQLRELLPGDEEGRLLERELLGRMP